MFLLPAGRLSTSDVTIEEQFHAKYSSERIPSIQICVKLVGFSVHKPSHMDMRRCVYYRLTVKVNPYFDRRGLKQCHITVVYSQS